MYSMFSYNYKNHWQPGVWVHVDPNLRDAVEGRLERHWDVGQSDGGAAHVLEKHRRHATPLPDWSEALRLCKWNATYPMRR